MNIFQAAVLGLVQGLAEFLPISSSGHLILARLLMGISDVEAATGKYIIFDVLLHAGTLLAVVVLFNDFVEQFFTGWFLGVSFLITAVFLLIAENVSAKPGPRAQKPGFKHAIIMGIMQAIALLPGVSRSGSTLTGGLCAKLDRRAAAKFAFMMSAPAILGSLVFEGKSAIENGYLAELELIPTIVGVVIAAVSGYLAIRFMLKLIQKASLNWFALYVAIVGVVVLVLQLAGVPGVPAFEIPTLSMVQSFKLLG